MIEFHYLGHGGWWGRAADGARFTIRDRADVEGVPADERVQVHYFAPRSMRPTALVGMRPTVDEAFKLARWYAGETEA